MGKKADRAWQDGYVSALLEFGVMPADQARRCAEMRRTMSRTMMWRVLRDEGVMPAVGFTREEWRAVGQFASTFATPDDESGATD